VFLSPEGGSGLAAYRQALNRGLVLRDERVVLFNGAVPFKYPMSPADGWLDLKSDIDLATLDFD
jgi:threonine synthase